MTDKPQQPRPEMSVNQRNAYSLAAGIKRTDATVAEMMQLMNSLNQTVTALQRDVTLLNQEIMILKVGGYNSGPTA